MVDIGEKRAYVQPEPTGAGLEASSDQAVDRRKVVEASLWSLRGGGEDRVEAKKSQQANQEEQRGS